MKQNESARKGKTRIVSSKEKTTKISNRANISAKTIFKTRANMICIARNFRFEDRRCFLCGRNNETLLQCRWTRDRQDEEMLEDIKKIGRNKNGTNKGDSIGSKRN